MKLRQMRLSMLAATVLGAILPLLSNAMAQTTDLAKGKAATASSTATGSSPSYANDSIFTNNWSASGSAPQWWYVNLNSTNKYYSQIIIYWPDSSARKYNIDTSSNGTTWKTHPSCACSTNTIKEKKHTFTLSPGIKARYVRVRFPTAQPTGVSMSISELLVNNLPPTTAITSPKNDTSFDASATITINATGSDPDSSIKKISFYDQTLTTDTIKIGEDATSPYSISWPNVAKGTYILTTKVFGDLDVSARSAPDTVFFVANAATYGKAFASTRKSTALGDSCCNDNDTLSRWCASSRTVPQWWIVNLGALMTITRFREMWQKSGTGHCYKYNIETSPDSTTWTLRVDSTGHAGTAKTQTQVMSAPVVAKWVRLTITAVGTGDTASLFDFKVFSPVNQYQLSTVPAPGTRVALNWQGTTKGYYNQGSQVTVTATPASDSIFSYWSGDTTTLQNPLTLTMNKSYSVTANFKIKSPLWSFSMVNGGNGTIGVSTLTLPNQTNTVYTDSGKTFTDYIGQDPYYPCYMIWAKPNAGFKFSGWTKTSGAAFFANAAHCTTFVTIRDGGAHPPVIQANFIGQTNAITITSDYEGMTIPSGTIPLNVGDYRWVKAKPAGSSYQFDGWDTTATGRKISITNLTADSVKITLDSAGEPIIRARFKQVPGSTHYKFGSMIVGYIYFAHYLSPTERFYITHNATDFGANWCVDSLLLRMKRAGCTHVNGHVYASLWQNGYRSDSTYAFGLPYSHGFLAARKPNGMPGLDFLRHNQIQEAFETAEKYGLVFIPGVAHGGQRCPDWVTVSYYDNNQGGGLHSFVCDTMRQNAQTIRCSCPLVPDAGFDYYLDTLLSKINVEFTAALPYLKASKKYLEYIHMDYDEMFYIDPVNDVGLMLGLSNQNEKDSINHLMNGHSLTAAQAFRRVYARSFIHRINQIHSKINPKTKMEAIMCMFDPQMTDGLSAWKTYLGDDVTLFEQGDSNVLDLPGLTPAEKDTAKKYIVFEPWQYEDSVYIRNPYENYYYSYYDFDTTYNYIASRGFDFIPWHTLLLFPSADPCDTTLKFKNLNSMKRCLDAARKYGNNCLGYTAAIYPCMDTFACREGCAPIPSAGQFGAQYWDSNKNMFDQIIEFSTLEYMQQFAKNASLPVSYKRKIK
jgi:hypothetical protein